jgi:hypothetical protein
MYTSPPYAMLLHWKIASTPSIQLQNKTPCQSITTLSMVTIIKGYRPCKRNKGHTQEGMLKKKKRIGPMKVQAFKKKERLPISKKKKRK